MRGSWSSPKPLRGRCTGIQDPGGLIRIREGEAELLVLSNCKSKKLGGALDRVDRPFDRTTREMGKDAIKAATESEDLVNSAADPAEKVEMSRGEADLMFSL